MNEELEPDELEICPNCLYQFPCELVFDSMFDGSYSMSCPICALRKRNELHGIELLTPFTGTMAHAMFGQAVAYLGSKAPKWAKKVAKMDKAEASNP